MNKRLGIVLVLFVTSVSVHGLSKAASPVIASAMKSVSPDSSVDQSIANEKAIWAAEKAKNKQMFAEFLATDYAEITADDGLLSREAVLKTFDRNGLQEYTLAPMKATIVQPGVVLLTYEYHVKEMHEKMHEGNFIASSIWANRSGKWVNVFFQETPRP